MQRTVDAAKCAALSYAASHFPNALAVLLSGSRARGGTHAESDLDVVIVDETVEHEGCLVEACAINRGHVQAFFGASAAYRCAPAPYQVLDAILMLGDPALAERVGALPAAALARGPTPLTDAERLDARHDLTLLRQDLAHAPAEALPAHV